MKKIRDMAKPLPGLLRGQRQDGAEPYRLLHFVVQQPVEEGLLLYNVLTRAVVLLEPEEARQMAADPASVPGLVEGYFAVPQSHDDRRLAREVRAVARMLRPPVRGVNNYTILPTTDCNARCFYCFEQGVTRIPMSLETAEATARYIVDHAAGQPVNLRWFGGEPLYNKPVITRICSLLTKAGVKFRSTMISNGFLFDAPTVAEAVRDWKLKEVQITLDGTEAVYNRVKRYIEPGENPFRRVHGNIRALSEAGVRVSIRLNIDRFNAGDLLDLADQLGEAFGTDPHVTVYTHALLEDCSCGSVRRSDAERRALFELETRLRDRLRSLGLARPYKLPHSLPLNHCLADNDACLIILPDGHIGKCDFLLEGEWIGHISEAGPDVSAADAFKVLRPELDACAECPFYPDCIRLAKCEVAAHCHPEDREEKLLTVRRQLLSAYRKDEIQD